MMRVRVNPLYRLERIILAKLRMGSYVLLLLLPCLSVQASRVTYVYTDQLGTPLAEADANGQIIATFDYRPYGSLALGTEHEGVGYAGHVNDPDTSLMYMQQRYYDAAIGRFLSVDQKRDMGGNYPYFNRYAYGNNNPILYIDPDGRAPYAAPLLQLRLMGNYIKSKAENFMVTIGVIASDQAQRTEIAASGTAMYGGGVTASKGLYNSGDSVGIPFMVGLPKGGGEGLEASIDVKYRLATFTFSDHPTDAPINFVGKASAHALGGGGVEIVYNPGGTVTAYLKVGVGAGESSYLGSVDFLPGSGGGSQQNNSDESEWMKEQRIRQLMGIGPENPDYLHR